MSKGEYYFNYIKKEEDLKDDIIFKSFDTNYINLNILPYIYYPIFNNKYYKHIIDANITGYPTPPAGDPSSLKPLNTEIINEIDTVLKNMKNPKLIYNRYLITPITITIVIVWIFLLLFILKYIHYNYNILYIYLISSIIIILLIFGSLWFLYVNSQLL
jgi:hypothetical protein